MAPFDPEIRVADRPDLEAVMTALAGLARDLGDPFHATREEIAAALFGPDAHSAALLAGEAAEGIAFISPAFSTVRGHSCVYVSDLWVDPKARGRALGRRLLRHAAREGASRWRAQTVVLSVARTNDAAKAFYLRLGFRLEDSDMRAILGGTALRRLTEDGVGP